MAFLVLIQNIISMIMEDGGKLLALLPILAVIIFVASHILQLFGRFDWEGSIGKVEYLNQSFAINWVRGFFRFILVCCSATEQDLENAASHLAQPLIFVFLCFIPLIAGYASSDGSVFDFIRTTQLVSFESVFTIVCIYLVDALWVRFKFIRDANKARAQESDRLSFFERRIKFTFSSLIEVDKVNVSPNETPRTSECCHVFDIFEGSSCCTALKNNIYPMADEKVLLLSDFQVKPGNQTTPLGFEFLQRLIIILCVLITIIIISVSYFHGGWTYVIYVGCYYALPAISKLISEF